MDVKDFKSIVVILQKGQGSKTLDKVKARNNNNNQGDMDMAAHGPIWSGLTEKSSQTSQNTS